MSFFSHAQLLYFASVCIGLDKGGLPGLGTIAVTSLLASANSPELSRRFLGLLLPVLAGADLYSCLYAYKDAARLDVVRDLVLPLAVGMFFGFLVLGTIDAVVIRFTVGIVVALTAAMYILWTRNQKCILPRNGGNKDDELDLLPQKVSQSENNSNSPSRLGTIKEDNNMMGSDDMFVVKMMENIRYIASTSIFRALVGFISGFLTVNASASALFMATYLLTLKLPMRAFNGTRAGIFLVSNLCKIPGQMLLGNLILSYDDALIIIPLVLASVIAAHIAAEYIMPRYQQEKFESLSWVLILIASIKSLFVG